MQVLESLRSNLGAESKAYGYTLSIWGSGAMLIAVNGGITPFIILMFIFGAVVGFGVLASVAFRGVFKSVRYDHEETYIVASIIHILASLGNVWLSYMFITLLQPEMGMSWLAFLIGFHASFSYNVLLLCESYLFEQIVLVEARILEKVGT